MKIAFSFCAALLCAQVLAPHAFAQNAPVPPALDLEAGAGLVVDNYDAGLFSGAFKDDKGTQLELSTPAHADGRNGRFLRADFSIVPGGFAGFWNVTGMAWDTRQDWSQARAISFLGWASKPLELKFIIKGDGERQYETTARLDGGKWQKVVLPTREWGNVAAGIGIVGGFDIRIQSEGAGAFALDELRVEGGAQTGQFGQKIELDPKIVFAKTLTPPAERSRKTYVVDARSGSDKNDGSQAKPFQSIQQAADRTLPGDTVLVKDGVYIGESWMGKAGLALSRSGAPDAWVTFAAYPGHRPHLASDYGALNIKEASYIEVRGFKVAPLASADLEKTKEAFGIGIEYSHHIRIVGNEVHGWGGGGIGAAYSDYLTIEGNEVHGNSFRSIYNTSGISLWEGRDFDEAPGFHNIIRGNISSRNENKGPTTLYGGKLTDGNGIIIDFARGHGNTLVENNICAENGGRGIHIFQSKNVVVRNNTLAGNNRTPDSGGSDLRANTSLRVKFLNNIVVGRDGQKFEANINAADVTYEHNLFWNYASVDGKAVGANNILNADPKLANAVRASTRADFRLQNGSPAIDAGSTSEAAPEDIESRKRPQGKSADIGAFEQ